MKSKKYLTLKLSFIALITILIIGCTESPNDSSYKINSQLALTEHKNASSTITGRSLDESTRTSFNLISKHGSRKVLIDSNQFKITLNHESPMIVDLSIDYNTRYPIFISLGDSIHLDYYENDLLNNFSRVSYSGNHSKENILLLDLKELLKHDNPNYYSFFNCSEEIFLHKVDSIEIIANEILQCYIQESQNENNDFKILAQSYIDFKIANYIEEYPRILEHSFRQGIISLSDHYLAKRRAYPLNQPHHLNNISFAEYAFKMVSTSASRNFHSNDYDKKGRMWTDLNCYFNSIDSTFKNKAMIDYLKYRALTQEIYSARSKPAHFFDLYTESKPPSTYLIKLEELLSEVNISAKDYVFKDVDGNDRYLSEFKNKIVYIDIWATWCGPCLQQRKYFEILIDRFGAKNNDIVFVGISIDTDIMRWEDMVSFKNMKGVQLIASQGFESQLCKDFDIGMIPRFMIVNRDGIIIEPNAMLPNMNESYAYLKRLIEEKV